MKKNAIISFIGSGPGDPELITVKGKRLLEQADVVVYAGSLVNERVLQYVKKDAAIYNSASMNLEEIMKVMVDAAKAGKKVARLHTGDPTLYSALREQADILEQEGIPYEVVSGVSSAFASAAALKTELTMPEITQTVIFTRLEGRTSVPAKERLSELAKHNAAMCIFLSIGMMEKVVEELKHGYAEDTPVAVVYRATWPDEKIVRGTLRDIAEKVTRAGIERQAMIIIGRTLGQGPMDSEESYGLLRRSRSDGLRRVIRTPSEVKCQKSKLYDKDFEHGYRKNRR